MIGTTFIFSGVELSGQQVGSLKSQHLYDAYLRTETLRVVKPYLALGVLAIFWALLILRTKFPSIQSEHEAGGDHGHFRELLKYPHFLLAVVAQFLYVGAQVGTGVIYQYVRDYTHRPEKVADTSSPARWGHGCGTLFLRLPDAIRCPQQEWACTRCSTWRW
jgi:FHS family L-fucose permease-like MFS transporter